MLFSTSQSGVKPEQIIICQSNVPRVSDCLHVNSKFDFHLSRYTPLKDNQCIQKQDVILAEPYLFDLKTSLEA